MKCSAAVGRRVASGSRFNSHPSTPEPERARFPRHRRLTRGAELRAVGRKGEGRRLRTTHLDLRASDCPTGKARVGFIVPKYGHSAVERNQLKRRLREIVRRSILAQLQDTDVVVRARAEAYDVSYASLAAELIAGVGRLGISRRR
ncbi:MAG TPA: ribonuclease P protein component [Gemmatimonadaceae bacterium]|nr:ribonuclease P protein component [Gemmatimonadaceae bacterium]